MERRLAHLFSSQVAVAVVQQPWCGASRKAHSEEDVLIARRREYFLAMREVLVPGAVILAVFQEVAQAVRNRFFTPIVDPKLRVASPAQRVVQFQEIR
jgi:hypothetical protein